jgi:hypothetical protein
MQLLSTPEIDNIRVSYPIKALYVMSFIFAKFEEGSKKKTETRKSGFRVSVSLYMHARNSNKK